MSENVKNLRKLEKVLAAAGLTLERERHTAKISTVLRLQPGKTKAQGHSYGEERAT